MLKRLFKYISSVVATILCLMMTFVSPTQAASASVGAFFLYKLSDFTSVIPYMGGRVYVDRPRNETYVLYQNIVKVFNSKGMEIYRFGDNENLGMIQDLAVDREGNILTLSYIEKGPDLSVAIIHCNYKGDPVERIAIKGIPPDFTEFHPDIMVYRDGPIYLADTATLRVVLIDANGQVQKAIDLVPYVDLKEKDRRDVQLGGFSVDAAGNLLFTLPVLFTATVLSPDGKVASFGEPGSIPGRFGIVADIIRDNRGNIIIADRLKSIVNVYDSNFNFLTEFGGRGNAPDSLIVPQTLAIDADDRLYVTQLANRGVSVFRLLYYK